MHMREKMNEAGRAACAAVLAAGLCWPCGLALADGEDDGAVPAPVAAAEPDAVETDMAEPSGGGASDGASAPEGGPAGDELPPADPASGASAGAADPGPSSGPAAGSPDGGGDAAGDGSKSADAAEKDAAEKDAAEKNAEGKAAEEKKAAERDANAKADEARAALSEADAALSRASSALAGLDEARAPFEAAAAGAPEAAESARALRDEANAAVAAAALAREGAATARVEAALASAPSPDAAGSAARVGESASALAEAQLRRSGKAADYGRMRVDLAMAGIDAALAEQVSAAKERELLALAEAGNSAAFDAEMALADCRKAYRAAQEAADSIPDSVEGAAALKAGVASDIASLDARRAAVQARVAEWYELAEGAVGARGALSFGAGVDFGLPEAEFVAKWGAAIDRFLSGRGAPLAGYGEAMARSAYKWRIDPRLCAAVSITESSGGLYCIKPHNAWGWGAADSDPYGLAWQWGSWEEAIEAWHQGVATNTAGLATARTLTAFGEIYASSTSWAQNTAASMRQITP